jgi:hypothetical protein
MSQNGSPPAAFITGGTSGIGLPSRLIFSDGTPFRGDWRISDFRSVPPDNA